MSIYTKLYNNLCTKGKSLLEQYTSGSGLHAHHIVPRHQGGSDHPTNLTYLTVREHIIAHFLLWKIHNQVNDLRAMHMLGARLTSAQRRLTGEYCRDNNLGIHAQTDDERRANGMKSYQIAQETQNEFFFWSTPEGRKLRASMGGKASLTSGNNKEFAYWASPEGRKERARLGSLAQPKKPATNGTITKKFKTDEDRLEFVNNTPGWRIGTHYSKRRAA